MPCSFNKKGGQIKVGTAMDKLTRRALLRTLAMGTLTTVGTVTLARTALASVPSTPADDPTHPDLDVQARAAELEQADLGSAEDAYAQFLNFRNGGRPFRNGGWRNGGGFRNGGWRNGGGFRNGGFRNGGFRNGGFRNGGGGFRNAFRNR
jgi:hypothetical protein